MISVIGFNRQQKAFATNVCSLPSVLRFRSLKGVLKSAIEVGYGYGSSSKL